MALTLNGSNNTIAGLAVGGLPDGIVDTDMIAADAVTAPKIGAKAFTSYALIKDQKSNGTAAGNSVQTTWTQRDLNTETADPDGIVSISSNNFTLGAGSYLIKWEECNYKGNDHTSRLYDVTNSAVKQYSQCTVGSATYYGSSETQGSCRVTITGDTAYRIEYYQTGGAVSTNGLGQKCNQGDEVYTQVEIYKEA